MGKKINSCIIVCVLLIGWDAINFVGSENILQHNLKGLVPIFT